MPLLGSVPLEPAVSAGGDAGDPVVSRDDSEAAKAFRSITDQLVDEIAPPRNMAGCSAHMLASVEAALDGIEL